MDNLLAARSLSIWVHQGFVACRAALMRLRLFKWLEGLARRAAAARAGLAGVGALHALGAARGWPGGLAQALHPLAKVAAVRLAGAHGPCCMGKVTRLVCSAHQALTATLHTFHSRASNAWPLHSSVQPCALFTGCPQASALAKAPRAQGSEALACHAGSACSHRDTCPRCFRPKPPGALLAAIGAACARLRQAPAVQASALRV